MAATTTSYPVLTFCTLLVVPLVLTFLTVPSRSDPSASDYATFVFGGCSQQKYEPGSPYETSVDSLLTSLVNSAPSSSYNHYTVPGSSRDDVVYGLYQCRGDLSLPDCATCVAQAVSRVGTLCSHTCGGVVQLQGCYIKYDNDTFLGVEDKTVVLKKCGPLGGQVPMSGRDAVLATLASADGRYRAGESGGVQGLAQCVGDLNTAQCTDCLTDATGLLKSCGSAISGDTFLAKCYVRYSTATAAAAATAGGGGGTVPMNPASEVPTGESSTNDNEGEKTFAIIIGLFAAVALIIVFAAFIRKVSGARDDGDGFKS